MASLSAKTPGESYKALLHCSNFTTGIDGTLRQISDGEGTASVLWLSTTAAKVSGTFEVTGNVTLPGLRVVGGVTYRYHAGTALWYAEELVLVDGEMTLKISNDGVTL